MTRDKRSSDDWRVIVDLSWPTGYSVNDGIPPDVYMGTPYKLGLPGPDDLAKAIITHCRARDGFLLKCAREIWLLTMLTARYNVTLVGPHGIL